jgi:E3 ubiquitin-protein ligase RNF13
MTGSFGPPPDTYNVTGSIIQAIPADYCPSGTDGSQINANGNLVLILRGNCTFVDKALLAQKWGAIGVVVGDNEYSNPSYIEMGSDSNGPMVYIPSVFMARSDYLNLVNSMNVNYSLLAVLDSEGEEVYQYPAWVDMTWWLLPIVGIFTLTIGIYYIRRRCYRRRQRIQRRDIASQLPVISYTPVPGDETSAHNSSSSVSSPTSDREAKGSPVGQNSQRKIHNDSCAICLEDFAEGTEVKVLPCQHGFHSSCIDPWLNEKSDLCPICKKSILDAEPGFFQRTGCRRCLDYCWCRCCRNQENPHRNQENAHYEPLHDPPATV